MYATWSGLGVFTLALVSYFAFNQSLNFWSVIGLTLIVIGVVLVNVNITLPK
jgi:small multidrug resistance pump